MPVHKQNSKKINFGELINPARVLFAIMIAVIIWLYPVLKPTYVQQKDKTLVVYAGGNYGLSCSYGCQEEVCTKWIPEGPGCSDPGEFGGCCKKWEMQCKSDCEEDPPPPPNQPPSISHNLTCTNNGLNGWCIGNLTLDLTASDPQGVQVIISGDINGLAFACPVGNTTCSIPLPEGAGIANYKVDSATTLSANGSTSYRLDSSTPALNGSLSGVPGTNNWYKSNVTLNVTASDSISGIASITARIDGGASSAVNNPLTFTDGIHTVVLTATDNAGRTTQTTQTVQVDTITPSLNISTSGTTGLNGWYISTVTVTPSAIDSGSGLASFEVSTDGNTYTPYTNPIIFTDGIHTYQVRATDNAGNVTETVLQTIQVDMITPSLNVSANGTSGSNGWYVSTVTVTPSANDSGSGLASFTVSTDGNAYTAYTNPIVFGDGIHTYKFKAIDNAGNFTETIQQTVKVDTTTPAISLNIAGILGTNGWYVSTMTVTPVVNDVTSGVNLLEATADGGAWKTVNALTFADGLHNYQFKVVDDAGNSTLVPIQNIKIDTIAPAIEMEKEELSLGKTLYYSLEDNGSGLYIYRAVIEDDDEKYKKIVWLDVMSGNKFKDDILWDGKFADGIQAGWGEYFVTLKISDTAGNESMKTAIVSVNPLSFLQDIPSFIPPLSTVQPASTTQAESVSLSFSGENNNNTNNTETITSTVGGENNNTVSSENITTTEGGVIVLTNATDLVQFGFTQESENTSTTLPASNILWGALATATVGAFVYEAQKKKREEEERRKREEDESKPSRSKTKKAEYDRINRAYQASLDAKKAKQQAALKTYNQHMANKMDKLEAIDDAKWAASQAVIAQREKEKIAKKKAEEQEGLEAYYQGRKAGEENVVNSTWDKVVNWIDKNQVETSMGVGTIVGLAAIGITLAIVGTVTLPVLLVAAGAAAVVAGVTVATGTVALNNYYDRPPTTNIWDNVQAAAVTAAVVSGVGLFVAGGLLTQATIATGNAIAGTCVANPVLCTNVGTLLNVVDTLEQASLSLKLAVETATYNPHAGETAAELQAELMDGGIPGNLVASEIGEQIAKLGDDAADLIATYGDDIIPLLIAYGDDAMDIIGTYGDEGIALLLKYGNDTDEVIDLVKEFGTPAVRLLDIIDPESANKLLSTLDDDVLAYAIEQGPDAVSALSRWNDNELKEFGPELALRAKKDAKVLEAISSMISLGPIDPNHLTPEQEALIKIIAENSTQYADEGQIVLGKWIDYGNGFTSVARDTGSVYYNPHPDMWELFGEFGDDIREDTTWLVNKQVIQTGIDKDLPFEYTLEGIPDKDIPIEQSAVQLIFSGETDDEIMQILNLEYIPIRMKEIRELKEAGYDYVFDEINNTFILSPP